MNLIWLLLLKIIGGSLPHNIECLKASVVVIPSYIYMYIIILNDTILKENLKCRTPPVCSVLDLTGGP